MCKQEHSQDLHSNGNSCFLFGFEHSLSCFASQRWQHCMSARNTEFEFQLWTCLAEAKLVDVLWHVGGPFIFFCSTMQRGNQKTLVNLERLMQCIQRRSAEVQWLGRRLKSRGRGLVPSLLPVLTSQEVTQQLASLGREQVIDVTHTG